jgi:hypothetical protein
MSESVTEVFRSVVAELDPASDYYLLNPSRAVLDALGVVGIESDRLPTFRVLASHEIAGWVRDAFITAARIETLAQEGVVEFRRSHVERDSPTIVGEREAFPIVAIGESAKQFHTDDTEFVGDVHAECVDLWADAQPYGVRAPALPEALEQAEARLGQEFQRAFEQSLTVADEFENPAEFCPIRATLLLAAVHEILHYDVSRWGEDVGVASRASYSRRKSTLESEGVIEAETVVTDLGATRHRLGLTDEYRQRIDEEGVESVLREVARTE